MQDAGGGEIERELGMQATYYFRSTKEVFKREDDENFMGNTTLDRHKYNVNKSEKKSLNIGLTHK